MRIYICKCFTTKAVVELYDFLVLRIRYQNWKIFWPNLILYDPISEWDIDATTNQNGYLNMTSESDVDFIQCPNETLWDHSMIGDRGSNVRLSVGLYTRYLPNGLTNSHETWYTYIHTWTIRGILLILGRIG